MYWLDNVSDGSRYLAKAGEVKPVLDEKLVIVIRCGISDMYWLANDSDGSRYPGKAWKLKCVLDQKLAIVIRCVAPDMYQHRISCDWGLSCMALSGLKIILDPISQSIDWLID